MNFCNARLAIYSFVFILFTTISGTESSVTPSKERVMTVEEFEEAINNYDFFKQENKTTKAQPLGKYELKMIDSAINEDNIDYGGEFDTGREISGFTGQTLIVGGGKLKGTYGENQGKTVLFDLSKEEKEVGELIYKLQSDEWKNDPYTGIEFKNGEDKEVYIRELQHKQKLYNKAFSQKNRDILEHYYTLNIARDVQPDMLGSITSESDMRKVPDNKFMRVEFENVPCQVFLNPKLYRILERIIKPGGKIELTITNACRRLIAPVIQNTKFAEEYAKIFKTKYALLETLHPTYHRLTVEITNH